jgi:hypothetical protein
LFFDNPIQSADTGITYMFRFYSSTVGLIYYSSIVAYTADYVQCFVGDDNITKVAIYQDDGDITWDEYWSLKLKYAVDVTEP